MSTKTFDEDGIQDIKGYIGYLLYLAQHEAGCVCAEIAEVDRPCISCDARTELDERGIIWRADGSGPPAPEQTPIADCIKHRGVGDQGTKWNMEPIPLDTSKTNIITVDVQPRPPGCTCHWEPGDSACPVHGDKSDE